MKEWIIAGMKAGGIMFYLLVVFAAGFVNPLISIVLLFVGGFITITCLIKLNSG